NRTEEKLNEIWAEIFGTQKQAIGIDDDFFNIGGHSLRATIMVTKIHKAFNVKLPLTEIFRKSSIRGLADTLREYVREKYAAIEAAEKKEYYHLTSAQKRLFVLQQLKQGNTAYNMPCTLPLAIGTETVKLEKVFKKLIRRHESLRTTFHMEENTGRPVQVVHEAVAFRIEYFKINENRQGAGRRDSGAGELRRISEVREAFFRPFDLAKAPLLRVAVMEITDTGNTDTPVGELFMMVDMHHIITDGTSQDLLLKELFALYRGEDLPLSRLRYRDYAEWLNSAEQKELLKQQEEY
ncbi:MAG: non-ribosomal peptide synthetase, partial [bacterium]|nr:non-ribosomal peptide synthetase [bacterium]